MGSSGSALGYRGCGYTGKEWRSSNERLHWVGKGYWDPRLQ